MSAGGTNSDRSDTQRLIEHYSGLVGLVLADRCELRRLIGIGGMGAVFEAEQKTLSFSRNVAVKLIPAHDPAEVARFEREARTVSRLKHPNTVTLHDFGRTEQGYVYMIMELLQGQTLHRLLKTEPVLDPVRAVKIAIQVLRSLSEAHRQGIVHRDIKPGNVFLCVLEGESDFVKVLDFGIAKILEPTCRGDEEELTKRGESLGTPRYMAPEQLLGAPVDHRTDLYAVGVILHRGIVGRHPFEGHTIIEMATRQAAPLAALPETSPLGMVLPAELGDVLRRALSYDPAGRFQSADSFRRALERVLLQYAALGNPDAAAWEGPLAAERVSEPAPALPAGSPGPPTPASGREPPLAHPAGAGPPTPASGPQPSGSFPAGYGPAPYAGGPLSGPISPYSGSFGAPPVLAAAPSKFHFPWQLTVLLILLAAGLGVTLTLLLRGPAAPPAVVPAPTVVAAPPSAEPAARAGDAAPPAKTEPSPPTAPSSTVVLRVESDPVGLKVVDVAADRVLGVTPFEAVFVRALFPLRVRYERGDIRYAPDVILADPQSSRIVWQARPLQLATGVPPTTAGPDAASAPDAAEAAPERAGGKDPGRRGPGGTTKPRVELLDGPGAGGPKPQVDLLE